MTLFVSNIPWDTDEDALRKVFGDYGQLKAVRVPFDTERQRARGYAFVEFADRQAAEEAMFMLHGVTWRGREFQIREAEHRPRQLRRQAAHA